jgi:tight adherence protein C
MIFTLFVGLVLLATAIALVAGAVGAGRARLVQNLGQIGSYGFAVAPAEEQNQSRLRAAVDALASRVGEMAVGRLTGLDEAAVRTQLMSAGIYSTSPRRFTGYRVLAAISTLLTWLWLGLTTTMPGTLVFLGAPVALLAGWVVPLTLVRRRAERRLATIDYDLPELIDLLVVTVEAGLGFTASLQVASERLEGPLGEELRLALQEQTMGLSTTEALKNMLERADTPAMRSFVRSMLQGETLGVSIGQIMRNLAQEMRKRRRAAAEERAQKAPIKILFPLIFLIFPAMFAILLGPAIFSFVQAIGS